MFNVYEDNFFLLISHIATIYLFDVLERLTYFY